MARKKLRKALKKLGKIAIIGGALALGGPGAAKFAGRAAKKLVAKSKKVKRNLQASNVPQNESAPIEPGTGPLEDTGVTAIEPPAGNPAVLTATLNSRKQKLGDEVASEMERREYMPGAEPVDQTDNLSQIAEIEETEEYINENETDYGEEEEEEDEIESLDLDAVVGMPPREED